MQLEINNEQSILPLNIPAVQSLLHYFIQQADSDLFARRWDRICLFLLDNETMQQANLQFFKHSGTTDVISQLYTPLPDTPDCWCGDILVNAERAMELGPDFEGVDYELAFYIAHGCLHLYDEDDADDVSRTAMHQRQHHWIRSGLKKNAAASFQLTKGYPLNPS